MKGSLTAAGYRVERRDTDTIRRLQQPWQSRAFGYYDALGCIKYAAQFYSRMLAPLRLYAAEVDDTGEVVETSNETAIASLDRIQDPGGGGRSGLQAQYGRLMFITGEGLLFQTLDPDTDMEQWEMLSTDELRVQDGSYYRYSAPTLAVQEFREPAEDDWEPVAGEAIAYRLWKRHPRFSMLADSTLQGVLDECEELLLLTQAVRARVRSRLAGSGILAVADEFSMIPLESDTEGDEDPDVDPFLRDLTEAMTTPIVDEGAASAVVPLVIRAPADVIEKGLKHIQIIDPTQLYPETGLRYELIQRIALGLDMPPEVLLGMTDANHWSAWQVDEQTWKGHGQPIADQLVADLTSSYYRPTLRAAGVPDWQRHRIAYDATAIINHPDRTKDAKDLYDKRAIGKKALRDAGGFADEDAPTQLELAEMVGIATRDSSLAWYGVPAPRGGNVEVGPGVVVSGTPGADPTEGTGADAEPGPPPEEQPGPGSVVGAGNGHARVVDAMAARIVGAADLALLRAREAAGNRLRSLAKRDKDYARLVEDVRAGQVAYKLGRAAVRQLGVSETDLVAAARDLILDALRVWGIDDKVAVLVAADVERHAARTLYDERPGALPASFTEYVAGLLVGVDRVA